MITLSPKQLQDTKEENYFKSLRLRNSCNVISGNINIPCNHSKANFTAKHMIKLSNSTFPFIALSCVRLIGNQKLSSAGLKRAKQAEKSLEFQLLWRKNFDGFLLIVLSKIPLLVQYYVLWHLPTVPHSYKAGPILAEVTKIPYYAMHPFCPFQVFALNTILTSTRNSVAEYDLQCLQKPSSVPWLTFPICTAISVVAHYKIAFTLGVSRGRQHFATCQSL